MRIKTRSADFMPDHCLGSIHVSVVENPDGEIHLSDSNQSLPAGWRVIYEGVRYHTHSDGSVFPCFRIGSEWQDDFNAPLSLETSRLIRQEASRQRRNRNARERNAAMRDLGMKRTPYGWE